MSVYKACDIRGPLELLSAEQYRQWGRILTAPLEPGSKVVVGGDVRHSTPGFQAAFIAGALEHPVRVVDLGTVPTPMVYFAQRRWQAALAAVVTASHGPPDVNGLKWTVGGVPPTEAEVQELRRLVEAEDRAGSASSQDPPQATGLRSAETNRFAPDKGSAAEADGKQAESGGAESQTASSNTSAQEAALRPASSRVSTEPDSPQAVSAASRESSGELCPEDVSVAYASWLVERWGAPAVRLQMVVDPGNGCWAGRAAELLRRVLPQSTVTAIHDQPDGGFPERDPDSARPENLAALADEVLSGKASIGVAFDGDGDRIALVDEQGQCLSAEETTWLLVQSYGEQWRDRLFVHDVKLSRRVAHAVEQLGGTVRVERSGHAFIRRSMLAHRALFGAEISGHFFYGELAGCDDALFTACRVVQQLADTGMSLGALRRQCPPIFMTGDLRVTLEPEEQQRVLERVAKQHAGRQLDYTDGVRVMWPDGWALVRSSVTAPQLTFRFEGKTPQALERLVRQFAVALGAVGDQVLTEYEREKAG